MKKIFLLFTAFLLGFPFNGCVKEQVKKPPIKIAIDLWIGYAYAFIAREKGFFQEERGGELVLKNNTIDSSELYTKICAAAFGG